MEKNIIKTATKKAISMHRFIKGFLSEDVPFSW